MGRQCKIERVVGAYGLDGMEEDLAKRWTAEGEAGRSTRELADYFNRAVLETAMREAGMRPLDGEVANTYRLLTDEEVSAGAETQTRRTLEREGVEVDAVLGDFVSHQTVYVHLTEHVGVEYEEVEPDPVESVRETVGRLRSRTEAVTESSVERLRDAGHVEIGGADALVDLRVRCTNCGTTHDVDDLLAGEGCGCSLPE